MEAMRRQMTHSLQPNQDVRAKQPQSNQMQAGQAQQPDYRFRQPRQQTQQPMFQAQTQQRGQADQRVLLTTQAAYNQTGQHFITSTPVVNQPIAAPPNQSHIWDMAMINVTAPPTVADLRTDNNLMDQAARIVAQNSQENDHGKQPKSGLKRDNAERVCRVILWPHEHVLRQHTKPPTYESLTISEFAAGNMRILAAVPGAPPLVTQIAHYLTELYDDATDTDWPSARFAHRVVLQAMENGRVDYGATQELRQLRSMALNRAMRIGVPTQHSTSPTPATRTKPWNNNTQNNQNKKPCPAYQRGECQNARGHQSSQG